MTKLNFKKISYDVLLVISLLLRHRKTSLNLRHNILPFWVPSNQNFWLRR